MFASFGTVVAASITPPMESFWARMQVDLLNTPGWGHHHRLNSRHGRLHRQLLQRWNTFTITPSSATSALEVLKYSGRPPIRSLSSPSHGSERQRQIRQAQSRESRQPDSGRRPGLFFTRRDDAPTTSRTRDVGQPSRETCPEQAAQDSTGADTELATPETANATASAPSISPRSRRRSASWRASPMEKYPTDVHP